MTTFSNDLAEILVFKTHIRYKKELKKIAIMIGKHPFIKTWNIDFQDKDKVLRIESTGIAVREVIQLLQEGGFFCEELQD